jgi:hypothetical protein
MSLLVMCQARLQSPSLESPARPGLKGGIGLGLGLALSPSKPEPRAQAQAWWVSLCGHNYSVGIVRATLLT